MRIRPYLRCAGRLGLLSLICVVLRTADAGSATWNLNPASGDWNTATNWNPATVPNGASDLASFGVSNTTGIALSGATEVNAITFNAGASAFTTTVPDDIALTVSGTGIVNNSGVMQDFVAGATASNGGTIFFLNNATAGTLVTFINEGGAAVNQYGSVLWFENSSNAGSATIINNGAAARDGLGAITNFRDDSSAADATIIANAAQAAQIQKVSDQLEVGKPAAQLVLNNR